MNQSYRPGLRADSVFGSNQPELRPHHGPVSTSFGNQCGIVKRGLGQSSGLQLSPPGHRQPFLGYSQTEQFRCYSPPRRPQHLSAALYRPDPGQDVHPRNNLLCTSPVSDDDDVGDSEFGGPLVQLPPSPGNDVGPSQTLRDRSRNGFSSPRSPDSFERCSPVPNGYLHFESTLFDSSDVKEEDGEQQSGEEDFEPFSHLPNSCRDRTVSESRSTSCSGADRKTYKPTVFNLMSKTISELNPTLSPSALPEITMREGWNLGEESDSDAELTSIVDPGLISPALTNSNVSPKHFVVEPSPHACQGFII